MDNLKENRYRLFLRGRVKFPTGGDGRYSRSQSVTRKQDVCGGSGENPGPTVKVWMGEGKTCVLLRAPVLSCLHMYNRAPAVSAGAFMFELAGYLDPLSAIPSEV